MGETYDRIGTCNADEEFWGNLLDLIEEGKVIPVLGEELATVTIEDLEVPVYRAIAEGLLEKYGLAGDKNIVLRPHQELYDAVAAVAPKIKSIQNLYSSINSLFRDIMAGSQGSSETLRNLAMIRNFNLFITTTFDDMLINAINDVRSNGAKSTQSIIYAPNLPQNDRRDIPESNNMPPNYYAVFYLFGRASASPVYAIHDEDILEYMYNLLTGHSGVPERMIAEIRSRNLLLIGCNFSDWLSRFFIRLSNQVRLSSSERYKKEILVGENVAQKDNLTVFLECFSQNTRLIQYNARNFIKELTRRWSERNPPDIESDQQEKVIETGDIFISYSRTDIAAAKILYNDLKKIGAGITWFDKDQIEPGDEWDRKIMTAIKRCKYFLPLISSTTESRDEGYFRKEWDEAAERDRMIQGRRFIIPVVLDQKYDGNASRYERFPDRFLRNQFGHAPGGHMSYQLKETIKNTLRNLRRGGAS